MTIRARARTGDASQQRAVVYAPFFPPAVDGGGPVRSLSALVENAPPHWSTSVVTSDHDLGSQAPLPVVANEWSRWHRHSTFYASTNRLSSLSRMWLAGLRLAPDLVYVNSFFNWKFSLVPQALALIARRSTVLVATRGEMGTAALARRSVKKRVLIRAYRLARLHRKVIFHASTEHEAYDIRRALGETVRVTVRKNDTLLPQRARSTEAPQIQRLIFVGRIVPHKGLLTLLQALRYVEHPVHLVVLGAEEDAAYARRCKAEAAALVNEVTFLGSVAHQGILDALATSTALVLPTAGENFGHVIAEALSVSCPVILADTTPWSGAVTEHGAGAIVPDAHPKSWAAAISQFLSEQKRSGEFREGARAAFDNWRSDEPLHVFDQVDVQNHK